MTKYFKKMVGERIYLSPINTDDIETYTKWINDPEVALNLGAYPIQFSLLNEKTALEELAAGQNYAIVRAEDDVLLGNIGLVDLSQLHQKVEVGLFIGEESNRSQGYGAEALRLMLTYCFQTLNMHNVCLHVHGDNARGISCYEKVGFKKCGQRREALFKNGKFVDLIQMDLLAPEYIVS